ncbi:MAG TPA: DUF309 domain-containing protein [Candidatus Binatia bacterium]|jgi:hypothetical protein
MEAVRDPRLIKGIDEFNNRLFFECHESLEEIWLEEHGEDRAFYQGLIQIAAGYLKWEQGVLIGAIKLWRTGLAKLEAYPAVHMGVDLAALTYTVKAHLALVEAAHARGEDVVELEVPILSLTDS